MQNAAQAYARMAQTTSSPRELEAQLLLRAAARLLAIQEAETLDKRAAREAVRFNRKLWTVFLSAVLRPENPLPDEAKANIRRVAEFVLARSMRLEVKPDPANLGTLISINRNVAAGLSPQR